MNTSQNATFVDLMSTLQPKAPRVIVINPTEQIRTDKLRVAAYARVSSDSDDQENSFAAQVSAYTSLIGKNEDWELIDIYADEGISGLSMEKREDFKRLIRDCRKGKIDCILTKSISRFSRNTRECLETIRSLKSIGVSICFEKEDIDTGAISDELMLTFFSGNAQQESMSISGNMRWGNRHRMKNGIYVASSAPYGYTLSEKKLTVDEGQAAIVRRVFDSYLSGKSMQEIARELTAEGIQNKYGKTQWGRTSVSYILKNERYIGDKLFQKTFATDALPFRQILNHGEKDRYYVKGAHQPIVDCERFEQAQRLISSRKKQYIRPMSGIEYPLSKRIKCGCCGSTFRRKVTKGKIYWVCQNHNKDKLNCPVTQIPESEIYGAFLRLYHKVRQNHQNILFPVVEQLQALRRNRNLSNKRVAEINKTIMELTEQNHLLNGLKSKGVIDSALFLSQSAEISRKMHTLKSEKNKLMEQDEDDSAITDTQNLIEMLRDGPDELNRFDDTLFYSMVDFVTAESNERLKFRLINGLELAESIERTVR